MASDEGRTTRRERRTRAAWSRAAVSVLAPASATLLGGCLDAEPRSGWAGAIDTLAGGVVRVSNPAEGVWPEGEGWSLVEDLRIGSREADGPDLFGRITDVEVDAEGRIYVLDRQASEVRIFGAGGAHLATFGRPGEGPGELKQAQGLALGPDGDVWIVDSGNQRYIVIDSAGELVEERRRFTGGNVNPWPGTILPDGRVVDVDFTFVGGKPTRTYTLYSPGGGLLDTVPMPNHEGPSFTHTTENSLVAADVPFSAQLQRAWDPRGGLWIGLPDAYRIVRTTLDGDTTLVIEREYEPVPVTAAEKDGALEGMEWFTRQGGRIDRSRIPDRHPAYRGLHPDREGHLWVAPVQPREGRVTADDLYAPPPAAFDVFDPDGRYLGRVESELPLSRPTITGTHVYGVTVDEVGVQYVVRLRIEGR